MSEARMARASLKKTIAYATELLTMIGKDDELEAWIQSKISDMDHHIESVYSYYKFGDDEDSESETEDSEASAEDSGEDMEMEDEGRVVISMDEFPRP
jgi:hypothetical protein